MVYTTCHPPGHLHVAALLWHCKVLEHFHMIFASTLVPSFHDVWGLQAPSTAEGAAGTEPNTAPLPNPWAPDQPNAAGGAGGGAVPPGLAGETHT